MRFTEKNIRELAAIGRIRGHSALETTRLKLIPVPKPSALIWLDWNLQFLANELSLSLEKEFKFHNERKFRFDYCFPAIKIAIEYNGIMSEKSRHTSITGYSRDQEKINIAQKEGWVVLSYTPLNYKQSLQDLRHIINKKVNG